jgi:hypothetical protein
MLRHWWVWLLLFLLPLTALTAYQMWRGGMFIALSLLSQLFTNLVLIAAVLVVRRLIQLWNQGHFRRVLQESLTQGQVVVKDKVVAAKGALTSLGLEVKESLVDLVDGDGPRKVTPAAAAACCPSCSKPVKPGARFCESCGKPIGCLCPRCGRPVRPQARFCEACGTALSTPKST